ncbi:MAG: hypothetical protein JWQ30_231, partial [Sediminibacterium sp.]|nr:hypothetical protein [Sediminibacterium sp.]
MHWKFATQVTENGIVYTHIPLRSRGKSLKGKIFNINAVGAKEYVIAAQKGDELSFSTALYIFDAIKFKSFKNFTGALITK